MKKFLSLFFFLVFALVFVGCNAKVYTLELTGESSVKVGEEITLTATTEKPEAVYVWTSSDEAVATVSDGVVTGVAIGTVGIVVSVEGVGEKFLIISVTEFAFTLTGNQTLEEGSTITLTASTDKLEPVYVWTSSDESIATVSNGVVTGVAAGVAVITVSVAGLGEKSLEITVTSFDYDAIPDTMESNDNQYQIAFVTDIGQLKDKSFNQGTWEGVKRFAIENEKSYKYYQPANGNMATDDDRYDAMAAAANGGADIIICAGYMQGNALDLAATAFPAVKFVFIDGWAMGHENITAIVFKEEQSGYFAGYATVMEGYTKLGFAGGGGGTNPACRRFGYGFLQGASDAAVEKNVDVSMKYTWNYGSTFSASAELQTMLNGWYSTGTEVVFAVGGSMCQSAFAAASANDGKVIGVDVDQSGDSATVITSATKGLREGTMIALGHFYGGTWATISDTAVNLGAAEGAVGLPQATWSMVNFTVEEYKTLFDAVVAGTVEIDDDTTDSETKTYAKITLDYLQ